MKLTNSQLKVLKLPTIVKSTSAFLYRVYYGPSAYLSLNRARVFFVYAIIIVSILFDFCCCMFSTMFAWWTIVFIHYASTTERCMEDALGCGVVRGTVGQKLHPFPPVPADFISVPIQFHFHPYSSPQISHSIPSVPAKICFHPQSVPGCTSVGRKWSRL